MNETTTADAQWIRSALSKFERPLIRYAARLLGGDVHRARDVVQDTFLKLWEAERPSVDGHLAQWLFTVCRNRALDVLRKEGRMTALDEKLVKGRETDARTAGPSAEGAESASLALDALESLPPRQHEAIRLKLQNGLSYREIASVMETTVSNVGVLIHTGIKTVRERLSAEPHVNTSVSR